MDARIAALCLALAATPAVAFDHSHAAWAALLQHVVVLEGGKASRLRYAEVAKERAGLKRYLESLSAVPRSEFDGWTRGEQMAFLINAYNAFTVDKILGRYPGLGSIWDYGKLFGNPFKDEFFSLLGRRASLDWIEHDTLRKDYRERRVHYALNCASLGCPMLREEPYVPAQLEAQLEDQARRFLSDASRNRYRDGRLELSKIYDWFKEDFEPREQYFAGYADLLAADAAGRAAVSAGKARLTFLEYDWSLNDFPSSSRR
ncbi:MAG TPA: DUF547 domain-containing protein [Burkholderiales bacterium]|nr:DUF547 domain-containing protein [Burkholderiales bacterium]